MYQWTSSFYRANLEKRISSSLQAEGTLGVNGVTNMMNDCVRLIWVKKPEMKRAASWGKTPDDLVVQNTLLVNIVLSCMWSGQPLREETGNCLTSSNGIASGQSFLFGEAKSAEEDYSLK